MCGEGKETERIQGRVTRVFFSSPRFSAGMLQEPGGREIKFAGKLYVREHEVVILHGRWGKHPKYGRQFDVQSMAYQMKLDAEGLAHYLANHPDIKGIGPVRARRIAEEFGEDFDRAITESPEDVASRTNIPLDVIRRLQEQWVKTQATNNVITWLAAFELTHHQVMTLVDRLGPSAMAILNEDPYLLVREIKNLGFKRVDKIARQMGTPKEKDSRIRAGLLHCIAEALDRGDCWVEYENLIERANLLLVMDVLNSRELIEGELDHLITKGRLVCESHGGRFIVTKPRIFQVESELAERLSHAHRSNRHFSHAEDLDALISREAPTLNPGQFHAVRTALSNTISLISGGAGVGKTYTVGAITGLCLDRDLRVVLAAPTGKAAKRLEEVVGHPASTIHRLLGYNGIEFTRPVTAPICADVLIIDETSMIDSPLAYEMFRRIDLSSTAVVLLGDHNQLPPIGPGNMLRDLIQTRAIPTTILTEVVRQAGELKENCAQVLRGAIARTSKHQENGAWPWVVLNEHRTPEEVRAHLLYLFEKVIIDFLKYDPIRDIQVLTPTHKGPIGTRELNIRLQRLIQRKMWGVIVPETPPGRKPRFFPNDKVLQTKNNYEIGVMNGTVGQILEVDRRGTLSVNFDGQVVILQPGSANLRNIQLAYAVSVHKFQGSEVPCAIVVCHKSHTFMHHRNLLYTGVTRAQKSVILLGDRWGMKNCVTKTQVDKRVTFLSYMLPQIAEVACPTM